MGLMVRSAHDADRMQQRAKNNNFRELNPLPISLTAFTTKKHEDILVLADDYDAT